MPWNVSTVETMQGTKMIQDLGKILPHEHVCVDITEQYLNPPTQILEAYLDGNVTMSNLSYVREFPFSCTHNMQFDDGPSMKGIIEDLKKFHYHGGRTIVECTSHGFGDRLNLGLQKLIFSDNIGVNFILGTGFASASTQNASAIKLTEEQIYDVMLSDLQNGFSGFPDIKAGFIGEVICDMPLHDFERRSIIAVGELQEQLRCSVAISALENEKDNENMMRIYKESGGKENKVVLCHVDRTYNRELIDYLATSECFLSFDQFGSDNLHCQYVTSNGKTALPDAERIKLLHELIKDDHFSIERFLLSQDILSKHKLSAYGGCGYSHIYTNVVPFLKQYNFSDHDIDTLTIENPQRWLRA